ncbi:MAG: AAA family ATPase [Candidatus Komeilibacteria bacterium]|nr:AAA family ATPase [Candidatus Komeilibacteria bacterium]
MARVISVVNQKGGVGKTTTSINLAAYLADMDQRVLLIDIDPQGNATSGIGFEPSRISPSVYDVLIDDDLALSSIVKKTALDKLYVAPANPDLAGANIELVGAVRREYKLWHKIGPLYNQYDYIIIDNPPSLGLLTINGLVAAEEVLIPVQTEYYALEGLSQLIHTINLVKDNLKPDLQILGVVMTMYDGRSNLSEAVFQELYRHFPSKIFRSIIPRNIRLAEAPSHGKPILMYDRQAKGAKAYEKLAREIKDSARY